MNSRRAQNIFMPKNINCINYYYYMTSSASGQYAANSVF